MTVKAETEEEPPLSKEQISLNNHLLNSALRLEFIEFKGLIEEEKADVWYQDPVTGQGPLHLAIKGSLTIGNGMAKARELIEWILMNGGVWNAFDRDHETPACLARRLGCMELYETMISAGVRTEMLLNLLERKQTNNRDLNTSLVFLSSALEYKTLGNGSIVLTDGEKSGVMMSWETEIMRQTTKVLLPQDGLSVLNIGFGLGIIDGFIQEKKPQRHVIVEAHPGVLQEMRRRGWYEKKNVQIVEGRWQDVCDDLLVEQFDAVYYDCFAESYADLRVFFDLAAGLVSQNGIFSFFNGLGADLQTFYDVYTRLVELELSSEFGFEVQFKDIPIIHKKGQWDGVKKKYFTVDVYKLPICKQRQ